MTYTDIHWLKKDHAKVVKELNRAIKTLKRLKDALTLTRLSGLDVEKSVNAITTRPVKCTSSWILI